MFASDGGDDGDGGKHTCEGECRKRGNLVSGVAGVWGAKSGCSEPYGNRKIMRGFGASNGWARLCILPTSLTWVCYDLEYDGSVVLRS